MSLLVSMDNINKTYPLGQESVRVLKGLSLCLDHGNFAAIMGPSGSGKSTLLNIMGCLDRSTSGSYLLEGEDVSLISDGGLSAIRSRKIGFIFQQFNLIRHFSVMENVSMPFLYSGVDPTAARERSIQAIEKVRLGHRFHHKPFELSGGEMQRVAIARAMAAAPKLILADEPTGNLDSKTGERIMDLLTDLNDSGTAIVIVTHDAHVADRARTVFTMKDGLFV